MDCFVSLWLLLQLIFRKVADVRREKELAERRKNEPQLDQNQDHLVRKIFSKFRRDRAQAQTQAIQGSQGQTSPDVEKAEKSDTDGGSTGEGKGIIKKLLIVKVLAVSKLKFCFSRK